VVDKISVPSLVATTSSLATVKSVTKMKGVQEETKGKWPKALKQGPATIPRKGRKVKERDLEQTVKSKSRLSEEIQLLRDVLYQLQSRIDEINVKKKTALCFCNQEWFSGGDDETVSTKESTYSLMIEDAAKSK